MNFFSRKLLGRVKKWSRLKTLAPFLIVLLLPLQLWAYASVTVPVSDPVYRYLDKLASFGLITSMIRGQRPYVRSEIARLIGEAMEKYPEFEKEYRENPEMSLKKSGQMLTAKIFVDRTLKRLKVIYRKELIQRGLIPGEVHTFDGRPMSYLGAEYVYLDEPLQVFLPNNGIGGIDARIQPLVQNRQGRHYQSGHNWRIGAGHWVRMGKYVALQFEHFFQGQIAKAPLNDDNDFFVQRLNGHFTLGKLDLEVGRDSINWVSIPRGGLGFTSNPRPLDFIKLSSISPFRFPFIFSKLGEYEMSLVVANLGKEYQPFKEPFLVAYKISSKSFPALEMGISQVLIIGGQGSPSGSFGQSILDFFNLAENEQRVNRSYNIEFIGQLPWRGTQMYGELAFGDFTTNMKTFWGDNTSYLVGMFIPRLTYRGNVDFRIEYRRLSKRYERSRVYTDGVTENTYVIGDPLGPDSQGIVADISWEYNPKNLITGAIEWQSRNSDFYQYQGTNIVKVADGNTENRILYRLGLRHLFNKRFVGHIGFGVEQVYDAGFVSGINQLNWSGEVGFRFYMDGSAEL